MDRADRLSPALSVIVPCYNEAPNISHFVERALRALDNAHIAAELLLVDDGSQDQTRQVIEALARTNRRVRGLGHDVNRGISECWKTAVAIAQAPAVLITDADLQYSPEDIPRLYNLLASGGVEIVQGSRVRSEESRYRRLASWMFGGLLNALFGTRLRDAKSGFVCAPRTVFRDMLDTRYHYRYLQHFIVINAVSKGLRIRQEPVAFARRAAGHSFIRSPLRFALVALTDLPIAVWEFRILNSRRPNA